MLPNFFFGFFAPLRALALLLRTPALLALSIIPIILTLLMYLALHQWLLEPGVEAATASARAVAESLPILGAYQWFASGVASATNWILKVGFWIFALLMLSVSSNVIALPFNDLLAMRTEKYALPKLAQVCSSGLSSEFKKLLIDLVKSVSAGLLMLVCLILSLVPVLNIFAALGFWFLIAFQYLSYPQTRRERGFAQSAREMLMHLSLVLGFGLSAALGFSVPLLGVIWAPLCVVAGTLVYARMQGGEV